MNLDIFITDFERTENSDELYAILGRALVIATRFDAMCEAAAIILKIKENPFPILFMKDDAYKVYVSEILSKYRTLSKNIKSLGLPEDISGILHNARKARNTVAHELSRNFTGCLDTKIDENDFIQEVSKLIMNIADGDIAISVIISLINHDPVIRDELIQFYKDNIVRWVVKR